MENTLTTVGFKVKTLDELNHVVPAAFATNHDPRRSDKYSFVSTEELLNLFSKFGWEVFSGKQNGKSNFARHIVRLENPDFGFMDLKNDKVKPQIILDNSHNGSSTAQIHMGLFRLVCTNGLVVAMPGMYQGMKFRHIGLDYEELRRVLEETAEQYSLVGTHIEEMGRRIMAEEERLGFVVSAYAHRMGKRLFDVNGDVLIDKVTKEINPEDILVPMRDEDKSVDLWTTYNLVQEKFVKGEFEKRASSGRRSHPRSITNATRNIEFNKMLWEVAESYMEN